MLTNKVITLREWREADLEALAEIRNDFALQSQLMTQPRPNSIDRVRQWLLDKSKKNDGAFFIIAHSDDKRLLGYIQIQNMSPSNQHCELGICIAPWAQGKGFGYKALSLLEEYIKSTFSMRKILLHVLTDNDSAIQFYIRYGFSKVGILKEHFYMQGCYKDVLIMEKKL